MCITLGYAGCRGDSSEPITMVQCGGASKEKRWHPLLLCQFQAFQHADEEGFIPSALHPRGFGKHGRGSPFHAMDFKSGFWQIKMAPKLQQYMACTVGNLRFYEFTHMLFGLCNALVTFQCLIQKYIRQAESHVLCDISG